MWNLKISDAKGFIVFIAVSSIIAKYWKRNQRRCKQMERYSMILDWKNKYCKNNNCTQSNRVHAIPIKLPMVFFKELEKKKSQFLWKHKKTLNSQSNLEKEEWWWKNQPAWIQTILQSYSHQESMVLAQKRKHRPMEIDRKPRDKPTHLWAPYLWPRRKEYTTEKR